jgi:molybdopterin-binding protein
LGRSQKILDGLKIGGLASRMPQTLSGGERQRVALARTLVTEPKILLLDEPLSALDLSVKRLILHDLNRINQEMRILILYVTHDRSEALSLGEHLLLIENGRVVEEGNPLEVLEKPSQESIASLVGVENILEGTILRRDAERGTMRCDLGGCFVEVPYVDGPDNEAVRFGLRSRDILIAAAKPHGLSAQNLLPGRIVSIEPQDFEVHLRVDCGISFSVTTTQNAVGQLDLTSGKEVWLVFKAHSCHILRSHG